MSPDDKERILIEGFPQASLSKKDHDISTTSINKATWHRVKVTETNPADLQPYFAWRPVEVIARTLRKTTQLSKMQIRAPLRRHLKARNPHESVKRLEEIVSTDPIFANVPSIGDR